MRHARWLLRALVLVGAATGVVVPATTASAAPSVDEVQQQIRKASTALEQIVEDYNRINEELKVSRAAASTVVAKLAPMQAQLDQARAAIGEMAARAYKTGELGTFNALLTSGSTGGLVDRMAVLAQVNRSEQAKIDAMAETARGVTTEKSRLDSLIAVQAKQQKDLAAKKTKIETDLHTLYELRRQAYGREQEAAAAAARAAAPKPPAISGKGGVAVRYAYGALGKPYVWAADGPNSYDCSGLTMSAWNAAGVSLPHNAEMQYNRVAHVSRSSLAPGDLVFYSNLGHVALYIGGGKVIHAPQAGEVVKIASVDMMAPYGYGRPG